MQYLSVGFTHCWFESVHEKCGLCSDVFNHRRSWVLTCKWVMSLSMSSGEVTQLSGMYLKFWGQGSLSTPLTQVIATASYPREMSLRKRKILKSDSNIFHCRDHQSHQISTQSDHHHLNTRTGNKFRVQTLKESVTGSVEAETMNVVFPNSVTCLCFYQENIICFQVVKTWEYQLDKWTWRGGHRQIWVSEERSTTDTYQANVCVLNTDLGSRRAFPNVLCYSLALFFFLETGDIYSTILEEREMLYFWPIFQWSALPLK